MVVSPLMILSYLELTGGTLFCTHRKFFDLVWYGWSQVEGRGEVKDRELEYCLKENACLFLGCCSGFHVWWSRNASLIAQFWS